MSQPPNPQKTPNSEQGSSTSLYAESKKIYARAVEGRFNNWRWIMVWVTQILFYGLCWLDWNGRQAVLFHLVERKFYLFGWVFWPQDVFFLAILLIISAYALFFFTAIAGRLWCGYACPQTVYTEIFMWMEKLVEGDRPARMKLDQSPMNGRKLRLKATKYTLWLLFSLWTGFTLVGYFTPMTELIEEIKTLNLGSWETFWIFFYGGFTYLMAGVMREQVCKYMCPYARFQAVMFDQDTLIITYDEKRGEPRGQRKKGVDPKTIGKGDCIDCGICVQVCPVGIDIRKGLQYECIGCAACIDACDQVMDKVGYPRGLIRYSTENALKKGWTKQEIMAHVFRPRTLIYGAILMAVVLAFIYGLSTRSTLRVDVLRDRTTLAREVEGGMIENVYRLQVMNMSETERTFTLSATGLNGIKLLPVNEVVVAPATTQAVTIQIQVSPDAEKPGSHPVFIDVKAKDDPSVAVHEKTTFLLPN